MAKPARDLELIRKLLIFYADKEGFGPVEVPPIEGYDPHAIGYNCTLLYDAGLLRCETVRSSTSPDRVVKVIGFDLTWEGHEVLDRIRAPWVWDNVLKKIREKGFVSTSLDVLKALADKEIRKRLE